MRFSRMMCACALMVGCSQSHPSDAVAPGIYELTVVADADACSPSRLVGAMGPVAVLVRGTALDAPVPDLRAPAALTAPRVVLDADAFHAETNRRIPDCAGAFVHEEWTLLEARGTGFEILHREEWRGLEGCGALAAMPEAPAADCTSDRRLRYELAQACPSSCRMILAAGEVLTCSC